MPSKTCAAFAAGAWLAACLAPSAAGAGSLRDALIDGARDLHVGAAYQSLVLGNGIPGVGAASYSSDQADLHTVTLSLSHSLAPFEDGFFKGTSLYGELTVGYLYGHQDVALDISGKNLMTTVKADSRSWTSVAGVGLDVPLFETFTLRPILLAGYGYVDSSAQFSGAYAQKLQQAAKGVLFDFETNALLLGGALALDYRRDFAGDLRLTTELRYDQLAGIVYQASDPALEDTSTYGIAMGRIQLDGPTPLDLFGEGIRWIAFARGVGFTDSQQATTGFPYFFELGGGLGVADSGIVPGLSSASLRSSAIVGDGVTGWTLGLSLEF